MNTVATTALVVIAVMTLLWTVELLVALLLVRGAVLRMHEFVRMVELEFRPVILDVREILKTTSKITQEVADDTVRLRGVLTSVEDAGENLRVTTSTIRAVLGSRLIPIAGVLAGLRGGAKFLWKHYTRRRK